MFIYNIYEQRPCITHACLSHKTRARLKHNTRARVNHEHLKTADLPALSKNMYLVDGIL